MTSPYADELESFAAGLDAATLSEVLLEPAREFEGSANRATRSATLACRTG